MLMMSPGCFPVQGDRLPTRRRPHRPPADRLHVPLLVRADELLDGLLELGWHDQCLASDGAGSAGSTSTGVLALVRDFLVFKDDGSDILVKKMAG